MNTFKKILKYTLIGISLLLVFSILIFSLIIEPVIKYPNTIALDRNLLVRPTKSLRILDINDVEVDLSLYNSNKTYITLDKISKHTQNAFISIEDKRFFNHYGIDIIRIISAAKNNFFSSSFKEGASTISQQLIKNTHLSNDKTIARKIQEIRIAIDLERNYSKEEILEKYLNVLYFGNNIYGIGAAAKRFFNKETSALTLSESALIAGIINNPSKYNPFINIEKSIERRDLVLRQMLNQKRITNNEFNVAISDKISLSSNRYQNSQYLNGIVLEACKMLNISVSELFSSNLTLRTNFNSDIKTHLTNAINKFSKTGNRLAAIIVDSKNGKVLSFESNISENISNEKRQPGSTIKPFTSFIPCLEKKLVYPITPILDEPTVFGDYRPANFKDSYLGWTTVENCLIRSLNNPAVKLMDMCGIEYAKQIANNFGLNFNEQDNSLAIALGGLTKGFTLSEITNAYQALANNGVYCENKFIRFIEEQDGGKIFASEKIHEATSKSNAFMINEMLEKCAKDGTAKRLKSINNICAKTGTVGTKNGNTDAFCVAYNSDYTLLVWENSLLPKENILGGGVPSKIALEIFKELPIGKPLSMPSEVTKLDIDIRQLNENKKVVLANENVAPRFRQKATFALDNIPLEYSNDEEDNYYDFFLDWDFSKIKDWFDFID